MKRAALAALAALSLALVLVGLGSSSPAGAGHDGSYCEAYYNDGEGQYAVPVSSAHTEAECAAQAGPNGYGWFPAAATTTTTAAPATTTTTAAPATTTTTAAPATTTTTAPTSSTVTDSVDRQVAVDIGACRVTLGPCGPVWALQPTNLTSANRAQGPAGWIFVRSVVNGTAVITRHTTGSAPAGPTGGMCIGYAYTPSSGGITARAVYPLESASPPGNSNTNTYSAEYFQEGIRYAWRPSPAFYAQDLNAAGDPGGEWCRANNPGFPIEPFVDPPTVDCYREFLGDNKVRLRARIGNPQNGAVDVASLSVPWEPGRRQGLTADFDLPASVVAIPDRGWRGICTVERTVSIPETSARWRSNVIIVLENGVEVERPASVDIKDVLPDQIQNYPMERPAFAVPPVSNPIAIVTTTSAVVSWLAQAGSSAVALTAPTVATATAGAVAGWTLGGVAVGGIAQWTGDDPWFCQFNPGYRLARDGYCTEVMAQQELQRSQVGLQDENGEWITTTTVRPWKKATTVTEVVIDPRKPSAGGRLTTAPTRPALTPQQTTGVSQSLAQQTGTDRAAVQLASPNPTTTVPGSSTPTQTDLDPRAPEVDPAPPPGDDGTEASGCWSWNPLSWFKGLACFVKWLLLPTPATTNRLGQLWAGLSDKAPFSFVTILGFPAAQFQAMTGTLFASVSSGDCLNFSAMGSAEQPIICAGSPDNPASYNPVPASIFAPARQIMLLMVRLGLVVLLLHYLQKVFN